MCSDYDPSLKTALEGSGRLVVTVDSLKLSFRAGCSYPLLPLWRSRGVSLLREPVSLAAVQGDEWRRGWKTNGRRWRSTRVNQAYVWDEGGQHLGSWRCFVSGPVSSWGLSTVRSPFPPSMAAQGMSDAGSWKNPEKHRLMVTATLGIWEQAWENNPRSLFSSEELCLFGPFRENSSPRKWKVMACGSQGTSSRLGTGQPSQLNT